MALRGEVVDLVRLHLLDHTDEIGRVRDVAIMKHEAPSSDVRILDKVIDAIRVEERCAPLDAMDLVALTKQELGEICTVLAGYAR